MTAISVKNLQEELRTLMAEAFNIPIEDLPRQSTPDNTKGWDSLSHLVFIAMLEQRYGLSISHSDAVTLLDERDIITYVTSKNMEKSID